MKIMQHCVALFAIACLSVPAVADTYVSGYTRSNGTYVAPHYRSSPDSSFNNNWSTKGNTNPYTGQSGYKTPSYGSGPSYGSPRSDSSYRSSTSTFTFDKPTQYGR